jgi:hypothetical protein
VAVPGEPAVTDAERDALIAWLRYCDAHPGAGWGNPGAEILFGRGEPADVQRDDPAS